MFIIFSLLFCCFCWISESDHHQGMDDPTGGLGQHHPPSALWNKIRWWLLALSLRVQENTFPLLLDRKLFLKTFLALCTSETSQWGEASQWGEVISAPVFASTTGPTEATEVSYHGGCDSTDRSCSGDGSRDRLPGTKSWSPLNRQLSPGLATTRASLSLFLSRTRTGSGTNTRSRGLQEDLPTRRIFIQGAQDRCCYFLFPDLLLASIHGDDVICASFNSFEGKRHLKRRRKSHP